MAAQSSVLGPAPVDSAVARMVMAAAFGTLGHSLARAALDSTSVSAWEIRTPTDAPELWDAFRAHLLRSVRGRALTAMDTVRSTISIGPIIVRNDSLLAEFTVGSAWRCPDGWKGSDTMYEVRAQRYGTSWTGTRTEVVGHSTSLGC